MTTVIGQTFEDGDVLTIFPTRTSVAILFDRLAILPTPTSVEAKDEEPLDERSGL